MRIDILYFEGCPNHEAAVRIVRESLGSLGLDAEVREIEVKDAAEARGLRFFGSPTIQVDGRDIDPAMQNRTDYSFSCRMYGRSGVPSREFVVRALKAATRR